MEGLAFYNYQSISCHLSVRDLCRAMQVCREWRVLWAEDCMWITHKRRVLAKHPDLQNLYMSFTRTEHFFKRVLSFGFDPCGFKVLCDQRELHPVAIAVAKSLLPPHSWSYSRSSVTRQPSYENEGVYFEFTNRKTVFVCFNYCVTIGSYIALNCRGHPVSKSFMFRRPYAKFNVWKAFVFGLGDATEPWRQDFIDFFVEK